LNPALSYIEAPPAAPTAFLSQSYN
jgi:hypothetical protein